MCVNQLKCDIKDINLAEQGKKQIEWAYKDMPVLSRIKERFEKEKPFDGIRLSSCVHVTKETAALCIAMKAGGADAILVASNPLSTQDDVAAALVKYYGIPVFGYAGESKEVYSRHVEEAMNHNPQLIIDDGCDIVATIHQKRPELIKDIIGSTEETTTGIIRLQAMEKDGSLKWPAVGVNSSMTKHLYDNRYGTGQSTIDGIIRATNILLAGKVVVVCGYGWCGKGCAMRARGLGANVIVTEVDPLKALEAAMEGFRVMPISQAAKEGDLFVTVTGDKHVVDLQHLLEMKDGAMVCNAGHFDVEINKRDLEELAVEKRRRKPHIDGYILPDGRILNLLAEGRLVNLASGNGHPAEIMDMSFSLQAKCLEYLYENRDSLEKKVYDVPGKIDMEVATLKAASLGATLDVLTPQQIKYLSSHD